MKRDQIVVGDHFDRFIESQVAGGRYGSASDVVQAGLRLLEEQEAQLEAIRSALVEGESSGDAGALDIEAFIARRRSEASRT